MGSLLEEGCGANGRLRGGFSAFARGNLGTLTGSLNILKALSRPEEEHQAAPLDAHSQGLTDHVAELRAQLRREVEVKLREYDADSGSAVFRARHAHSRSFVEHYHRHKYLRTLRSAIRKFYESQPCEFDRPPCQKNVWKVTGGADRRDLIVRSGPTPSWPKLPDKLAVGSWVEEEEMVEDRIRYNLLWGTGPEIGWVSVMLRDEVLALKMEKVPLSMQSKVEARRQTKFDASFAQLRNMKAMRQFSSLFGDLKEEAAEKDANTESEAIDIYGSRVVSASEAAKADEEIVPPPRKSAKERIAVIGLMAANIKDEAVIDRLCFVLRSVHAQETIERGTEFVFALSWYAPEGELSDAVYQMLGEFEQRLKSKSWVSIRQPSRCSKFEHLCAALPVSEAELRRRWHVTVDGRGGFSKQSAWVIFGDGADIWHHRRVDSYIKAIRAHGMLDGVGVFASLAHVNMIQPLEGSDKLDLPTSEAEVDELLGEKELSRSDSTNECQNVWRSLCEAGANACEVDAVLDLPMEYFDFCPRLRIMREFLDSTSAALLAHRFCDLSFLKFVRNYAAYGAESGLEVSYFRPNSWMYFSASAGAYANFERSVMSAPTIRLRSVFDRYVSVKEDSSLEASKDEPGRNEEFLRVANDDGTTSLLTSEGWYISVGPDGSVCCNSPCSEPSERFEVVDFGHGAVSFWNVKRQAFLVAERGGSIEANNGEVDPTGRRFYWEVVIAGEGTVADDGTPPSPSCETPAVGPFHTTRTFELRAGDLEFAREECERFAAHSPGLLPEKLARLFAVFRHRIELSLVELHRKVFDQREFDTLILEVAHMTFKPIFARIAAFKTSTRNKVARELYEVFQRFATMLAGEMEVKVLWHNCEQFQVPAEKMMSVWLKYSTKNDSKLAT